MIDYADPKRHAPPKPITIRITYGSLIGLWWTFLGLLALAVPVVVCGIFFGPLFGAVAGVFALLVLFVSARCVLEARRRTAALLLGHLEQAVRLNLPISPMLHAAQQGETLVIAARLVRFRIALEDGAPAGDALAAAAPGAAPRTIEMLNSADRNGHLPDALRRMFDDEFQRAQHDPTRGAFARAYVIILVLSLSAVLGTVGTFVMPKFSQIFLDFRVPLPQLTRTTMRATLYLAWPVVIFAAAALVALCARAVRQLLVQRPQGEMFADLFQRLIWITPIFGRLARDRGLADACHAIADAMHAGRPAPEALAEGQLDHINVMLRERMARWADLVSAGGGLAESARQAWMPRLVCGLLNTAQPADIVNVLRFLARYYEARFSRIALLLQSAVPPLLALFFGLIVAAVTLSLFMPMIRLIEEVNPNLEQPW